MSAGIVRYLVVETGGFFSGRRVLISPIFIPSSGLVAPRLPPGVDQGQGQEHPSPVLDVDKPVSRQHELDYFGYYGYPRYWGYSDCGHGTTRGCSGWQFDGAPC